MNSFAILVNSAASRAGKSDKKLQQLAQKNNFESIIVTEPESINNELAKIVKQKPDTLVIGGGDGTVISSIDQCLKLNFKGNFGIIPLGTSNYLARNLRISLNPAVAFKQAINGSPKDIHLGKANDNLFALMSDLGASVRASKEVTFDQKKRYGQVAYFISTIKALKSHSPFGYSIEYDGESKVEGFCHNILVVNSNLGRQIILAPDSKLNKDSFTVSVYKGRNNFALFANALIYILSLGKIKRNIHEFEAKDMIIKTLPQQDYSVDGEIKQKTPLKITMLNNKIPIITPKTK